MAVDFGEKRVMDDGWALRAQQDIQDRNAWSYNKMLNAAKDSYANQSASNDAWWDENVDNPILRAIGKADTKLVNFLSGQGTEKSFLNRHGFTPEIQEAGAAGNIGYSDLANYLNGVEANNTNEMETGYGAVAGLNNVPLVGGILNYLTSPIAQLSGAARAIGTDRWNNRDHISDAAALGQVGLAALTAGFGTPATLGARMGFGAATGAAENALDTIRQYGKDTNSGELLGSAAIGGAFGAGIPLAGAGLGKITQRGTQAIANKVAPALGDDAALAFAQQAGKGTQFGAGLRDLGGSAFNRFNNMSKLGKAATVGGIAAGGFGLNNLLRGNNDTYGNNYYGGY